jgi:hypothetical protein
VGEGRASNWCKVICRIRCGTSTREGSMIIFLGEFGMRRELCSDSWVIGISLKSRFNRLFEMSLDKDNTVVDMLRLGW